MYSPNPRMYKVASNELWHYPCLGNTWAVKWENIPSDMCAQRRLQSASASAQSDYSLHCPHEETLHSWLFKMRSVKIRIRLRGCAGWSESSLGALVRMYVFWLVVHVSFHSTPFSIRYFFQSKNIVIFLIYSWKHMLWVLIRSTSPRRF